MSVCASVGFQGQLFAMKFAKTLPIVAAGVCLALAGPASADVKDGVDAWSRGEYAEAVRQWRGPAEAGDADAQFNMAQAYRLGRGVERNAGEAEILYAKAAAQGHIKAADNYGLMLFQAGRREEAMPYVLAAAERGDPRAQYLLGIAHFNADLVEKDWVRAYALLTLANSAGLPQAAPAIRQMDGYIPLDQRQQAQALAQEMKSDSDATRAQQLAAADLALGDEAVTTAPAAAVPPPPPRAPAPVADAPAAPSVVSAQAAIAEASRVTGTETPAEAGADHARPAAPAVAAATPATPTTPTRPSPPPSDAVPADGPWRVQLGAFSVPGNADRLWKQVGAAPVLAGKAKLLVPEGRLTKLQAGGFASRSAAQAACDALQAGGAACLVTR